MKKFHVGSVVQPANGDGQRGGIVCGAVINDISVYFYWVAADYLAAFLLICNEMCDKCEWSWTEFSDNLGLPGSSHCPIGPRRVADDGRANELWPLLVICGGYRGSK